MALQGPQGRLAAPPSADRQGIATVDLLLSRGAELEAVESIPDDDENFPATPLWYAVARGANLPLVEHLLRRGASPGYCLWAVVWRDDGEMCRALLEARPRLDLVFNRETPLFYAARLKRLVTLGLLLEAGADPSVAGPGGATAAEIARRRGIPAEIAARLSEASRKPRVRRRR